MWKVRAGKNWNLKNKTRNLWNITAELQNHDIIYATSQRFKIDASELLLMGSGPLPELFSIMFHFWVLENLSRIQILLIIAVSCWFCYIRH